MGKKAPHVIKHHHRHHQRRRRRRRQQQQQPGTSFSLDQCDIVRMAFPRHSKRKIMCHYVVLLTVAVAICSTLLTSQDSPTIAFNSCSHCNGSDPVNRSPVIYPHLQGGLGNQMFILAMASIFARETARIVVVNKEQTGVYSFGAPQPVFWHTVFHSPSSIRMRTIQRSLLLSWTRKLLIELSAINS